MVVVHRLVALWHVGASWIKDQTQADSLPLSHQGSAPFFHVSINIMKEKSEREQSNFG